MAVADDSVEGLATPVNVAGSITAQGRLRATVVFNVGVRGTITSRSQLALAGTPGLVVHITGRVTSRTQLTLSPTPGFHVNMGGRITGAAKARLGLPTLSPQPVSLSGGITSQSVLRLDSSQLALDVTLSGGITGQAKLEGLAGPYQTIINSLITAAAHLIASIAEIQVPLPPYPPPFPTLSTIDYLNRITSEHNQKPNYMATVAMNLDPLVEDQQLVAGVWNLFDLDYCVGQQEDFTGQWIGKSRWIELPAVFFSWDEEGLGWNQANWRGPADSATSLEMLDDYHYRLLLYANIIANHWNGSIPDAYAAWDTLFQYTGLKVIIQDYGNMTMLYGLLSETAPDVVLLSLFTTGQMDLRPEGVELRAYALQSTPGEPFFAWDSASDSVHGWDTGSWGLMLVPGQSYIPGVGTLWDAPSGSGTSRSIAARNAENTTWDDGSTNWDTIPH